MPCSLPVATLAITAGISVLPKCGTVPSSSAWGTLQVQRARWESGRTAKDIEDAVLLPKVLLPTGSGWSKTHTEIHMQMG